MMDIFHFRSNAVPGRVARETQMCEMGWGREGSGKKTGCIHQGDRLYTLFAFPVPVSYCVLRNQCPYFSFR